MARARDAVGVGTLRHASSYQAIVEDRHGRGLANAREHAREVRERDAFSLDAQSDVARVTLSQEPRSLAAAPEEVRHVLAISLLRYDAPRVAVCPQGIAEGRPSLVLGGRAGVVHRTKDREDVPIRKEIAAHRAAHAIRVEAKVIHLGPSDFASTSASMLAGRARFATKMKNTENKVAFAGRAARLRSMSGTMPPARAEADVAAALAALSAAEIVSALGAQGLSPRLRGVVERVAMRPSRRLGRTLAHFDALIGDVGIAKAARSVLLSFGAALEIDGSACVRGPLLVVTNHPGAYDALSTIAALARDDVALIAGDRAFLRAMPALSRHLVFVDDTSAFARVVGFRRALAWLADGHALVQFGAGVIEPDARFAGVADDVLGAWSDGTGALASRASMLGAAVVPAFVSGVHSRRAKRLAIVRWAERRGITTIAPLIQATMPGFHDVAVSVRFGAPIPRSAIDGASDHGERTKLLRAAVGALAPPPSRR